MAINEIVAAIALETATDPVAERALQLARQHGAHLVLVHVLENLSLIEDVAGWATLRQALEARAREHIEQLLAGRDRPDLEIVIEQGRAHARIEAVARARNADLLIIGPGNPRTLGERLLGSTADRLTNGGFSPILMARTAPRGRYRRVTVATDFSPSSQQALARAVELAPDAALRILHAVDLPLPFEQAMLRAGTSRADIDRYRRNKRATARETLDALLRDGGWSDLAARIEVVEGAPGDVLAQLSRAGRTDLLAVGRDGGNAVARALLGSVARRVLHGAACDVLIASAPAAAEDP
ncbi:MAG TPA: universal stress protein [Sphingomonadaceae bacterium]|nr:universal stress protein [Sphingomonadaceae bacterium]